MKNPPAEIRGVSTEFGTYRLALRLKMLVSEYTREDLNL